MFRFWNANNALLFFVLILDFLLFSMTELTVITLSSRHEYLKMTFRRKKNKQNLFNFVLSFYLNKIYGALAPEEFVEFNWK